MSFIVFVLLLMAGISLFANRQMLIEARDKGEGALTIFKADAGKDTLTKKEDEVRREITAEDSQGVMSRVRRRFGFRELSRNGDQLLLNPHDPCEGGAIGVGDHEKIEPQRLTNLP
jgi:hypothetical protein